MPQLVSASAALKEWSLVCQALAEGRQLVLLRKGGLLDEDGVFHLEHREFYLSPTWLHQERGLVKPEHQDLFEGTPREAEEDAQLVYLRYFARVEQVWGLSEDEQEKLAAVRHIWSQQYLDLRFSYKPEKPLLCAALRVYALETPHRYPLRPQDLGCRSWMEWKEPLGLPARPVLAEAEFASRLNEIRKVLG